MIGKILIAVAVISGGLLFVLLNTTTPASAGAFGVLGFFVLTYLLLLSIISFFVYGISRFISLIGKTFGSKNMQRMSMQKAYYFSTVIALAPVIIISMQSVSTVGVYEVVLLFIFELVGCIYVAKRSA